jgi:hypothetical protein
MAVCKSTGELKMFSRLFFFAVIAGLVYLNYTTPTIEDHKAFLLDQLQQAYPIPENTQAKIWKDIDYSNFLVCSFMKTRLDSKMITAGYLKKVKLIDNQWLDKVRGELQQANGY